MAGRLQPGTPAGSAAFAAPLPAPGVVAQALRWLGSSHSPFAIRPRADPALVRWLWLFVHAGSPERYRAGLASLARFAARAVDDYERLCARGLELKIHKPGLLLLARSRPALRGYRETLHELAALGYAGLVEDLDGDEARAREPAVGPGVSAAVYASLECFVRAEALCSALADAARREGVVVRDGVEVRALRRAGSRWILRTATDEEQADVVVVAAGVWTRPLLRPLGVRLALEGAKGYSVTTEVATPPATHALYFSEAKVAYTPYGRQVRLAGTLELAGFDSRLRRSRLEALSEAAAAYLWSWRPTGVPAEWAGFRPLAADGLPIIGEVERYPALFVATGHGMLGVTLAPTTAVALRDLVLGLDARPDLEPFRPDRFGR